jgi:hypothetical protein
MITIFDGDWEKTPAWAAMYRGLGLQVVPAHAPGDGGQWKRPRLEEWTQFRDELAPDAVFDRWYHPQTGEHKERQNMGLITGRCSGNVFAIDLDLKPESRAFAWWSQILDIHNDGDEPLTATQRTGGGGRQLLFRAPPDWTVPTFKSSLCVDVRGQGGFIMCPPSLHESGKVYAWEFFRELWNVPIADAAPWLRHEVELLQHDFAGDGRRRESIERMKAEQAISPFGRTLDGREDKMMRAVWGAVIDLRRDSPITPPLSVQEAEIERVWGQYERTTKTRLERRPDESNGAALDREGRGRGELVRKWAYAMKQWDTKVAEAAKVPKPEDAPAPAWGAALVSAPALDSTLEIPDSPDPISAGDFHGQPPERLWLVPDWIAQNEVNSLYGMGGTGKSLLAQQLAYSIATGESWLGLDVKPCGTVLAVLCEDKLDELHRRHEAIRLAQGHAIGNPYKGVYLWPRYGFNNTLLTYEHDAPVYGPFHDRLKQQLQRLNPGLLILDTIRDVFGGDERDPQQANAFLKTVLGGLILAQKERGHSLTVMLVGHPSVLGAKEGTGLAGSLAWENGVRCRLYLSKPEDGSGDERTLAKGKANYSASGAETGVSLLWHDGVFVPTNGPEIRAIVKDRNLTRLVRDKVEFAWSTNRPYTARPGHDRALYKLLPEQLKDGTGCNQATALQAIREAIDDGLIILSKNSNKRGWKPAGAADD